MPKEYRDSVIFGSIHGCSIKRNVLKKNGSTFIASRADDFLQSGDKNFRPINLRWGPNGEIYCIDWHDQNPCHQAAAGSWDYEHGRVYRVQTKGLKTKKAEDLEKKTWEEQVALLQSDNPYVFRTVLRLISAGRCAGQINNKILQSEIESGYAGNLRSWWAWSDNDGALYAFHYPKDSSIVGKAWKIRTHSEQLIDANRPNTLATWSAMAAKEAGPVLRRELASAGIRLGQQTKTHVLLHALMSHSEDAADPVIPQLLWLAYEPKLVVRPKAELDWMKHSSAGNSLVTNFIVPRAMRRLVATNKPEDLTLCLTFVAELSDKAARTQALSGLAIALDRRTVDAPAEWPAFQERLAKTADESTKKLLEKLAVAFRDP